jgi:hypothetical protein
MGITPKTLVWVLSGGVLLAAGSAGLAAPEQDRPGQMTQGKVWIQNQGDAEAVPVTLQNVASVQVTGTPVVQVSGTPTVAISPSTTAQVRRVRQPWDYQVVTIAASLDLQPLSKAGQDGWETTGLQFPVQGGFAVVLKRPR